jgi:hypothetical protein
VGLTLTTIQVLLFAVYGLPPSIGKSHSGALKEEENENSDPDYGL